MSNRIPNTYHTGGFNSELWHKQFYQITEHRNAGMQYEHEGNNDAAITEYAAAIRDGESIGNMMFHAYRPAYDRIIALLRRTPDIESLELYCRAYIAHPVDKNTNSRINKILKSI